MARVMSDCRRFPSDMNCSLTIIGDEQEVLETAVEHAVSVHGHQDTPELREQVRGMFEPEENFEPGTREQEPLPPSMS